MFLFSIYVAMTWFLDWHRCEWCRQSYWESQKGILWIVSTIVVKIRIYCDIFDKNILSGSLKKCSLFCNDLIFALVFHYSWHCGFDTDLIKFSLAALCREPKHYSFHHLKLKYSFLKNSSKWLSQCLGITVCNVLPFP